MTHEAEVTSLIDITEGVAEAQKGSFHRRRFLEYAIGRLLHVAAA